MNRTTAVFTTLALLSLGAIANNLRAPQNHSVPTHPLPGIPRAPSSLDTTGEILRTISVPVPTPTGEAVSIATDCNGNLFYTNYLVPILYMITSTGTLIDSVELRTPAGAPINIDEMAWDQSRGMLWGAQDATFAIYLIDPVTGTATFQFQGLAALPPAVITDGLAVDPSDGSIWHSPDLSDSIAHFSSSGAYLGSMVPLGPTGTPDRQISGILVGTQNRMYVAHNGQGRVSIVNKITGVWMRDLISNMPGRVEGLECDPVTFAPDFAIWMKDALNNTVSAVQVDSGGCSCQVGADTCQFPYSQLDMGDLAACNYPTLVNNPAHGLSGVAWLGQCISGETAPHAAGQDSCNDGVTFLHAPWRPCTVESLAVNVTAGPNYSRYQACGGQLYLNAWKDGNLNGSFCDEIACVGTVASEWIIQDLLVTPGSRTIAVLDPGVLDMGIYSGIFRFRLTSQPVGRFGFGQRDTVACPNATCGTYALDFLGEVEDYTLPDFQLAVSLSSFDAVPDDGAVTLRWVTASESANDHFEILRDGRNIAHVPTQGNGPVEHIYTYRDPDLSNGSVYNYTLIAVDINGTSTELRTVRSMPNAPQGIITEYALRQNYPNPFNPNTEISFDVKDAGIVTLKVYNLLGREVATLVNREMPSGTHHVKFDASRLASGVYLYRLEVNGFAAEKKMLLMK